MWKLLTEQHLVTRKTVAAMRASEILCCKSTTGSYYHIIPRAGSWNKRLSLWNMLQDFVHQFFTTALPSLLLTASGTGGGGKKAGQSQDRSDRELTNGRGGVTTDQGGSTNGNQAGHWPLPPPRVEFYCCIYCATIWILYRQNQIGCIYRWGTQDNVTLVLDLLSPSVNL